ncbi:MAG TPA: hypothetical protein PK640_10750 [Verrucomicrobiota bacterium]|nr:hypothetical protein [Verrucomicrobiota bacterium]
MTSTVEPVAHIHCDERGRLLFSQDEDLIPEAVRCQRKGTPFATAIFARQLDLSISDRSAA